MTSVIENRTWRYATKKFDSSKKISTSDLETVLEATRLSASSYGLQPYYLINVEDEEIRKKLQPASWGQTQIVDASHLFVFANKVDFDELWIDSYLNNVSETRNFPLEKLKGYGDFMKSKLTSLPKVTKGEWAIRQVYLALGNAMQAAAELKIDTCPMEGFEPEKYNQILGLNDKGLNAAVVLTLGYRSEEDQTQNFAKVRNPKEEFHITI